MFALIQTQDLYNQTLENDNTTAASRRTHQITTILDRLLLNYDLHTRPNFGGSNLFLSFLFITIFKCLEGPTKIDFDILVSSFGPIQDVDMVCFY